LGFARHPVILLKHYECGRVRSGQQFYAHCGSGHLMTVREKTDHCTANFACCHIHSCRICKVWCCYIHRSQSYPLCHFGWPSVHVVIS